MAEEREEEEDATPVSKPPLTADLAAERVLLLKRYGFRTHPAEAAHNQAVPDSVPPAKSERPGTKVLDYIGLGLILAPPAVVFEMYLRKNENIDWRRAIVSTVVAWAIGALVLVAAPRWEKLRSRDVTFHWQFILPWQRFILSRRVFRIQILGRLLIVAFLVSAPFAFSSIITSGGENDPVSLRGQKATLIEWLKNAQNERDKARSDLKDKEDELEHLKENPPVVSSSFPNVGMATSTPLPSLLFPSQPQLDSANYLGHVQLAYQPGLAGGLTVSGKDDIVSDAQIENTNINGGIGSSGSIFVTFVTKSCPCDISVKSGEASYSGILATVNYTVIDNNDSQVRILFNFGFYSVLTAEKVEVQFYRK